VIEGKEWIIPIEVKSGTNLSATSFSDFMKKYTFELGIKFSKLPYQENEKIINAPLYLVSEVIKPFL
jgi:hypothetical protein